MLVDSVSALEAEMKMRINESLRTHCADKVKKTMKKHIQSDVYDVYEPQKYTRRHENDGLIADENIVSSVVDGELIVRNEAKYNGTGLPNLAELIEYGHGAYGEYSMLKESELPWPAFAQPRPFIENTQEDLNANKYITNDLKRDVEGK